MVRNAADPHAIRERFVDHRWRQLGSAVHRTTAVFAAPQRREP